jgi:hypothetical protein
MIRFFCRATLILLTVIAVQRFCHKQTDGFALCKIQSRLPYHADWDVSQHSKIDVGQVQNILKQPFRYLGKGAQCYVFVSEDDQYVLKFFRLYHLRPPIWMSWFRFPFQLEQYRQKKFLNKEMELAKDFESYKIAFEKLQQETGLLFVHLNKTTNLKTSVDLYDKIGVLHKIDIDSMEFVLQRKAFPFYAGMEKLLEKKDVESVQRILHELVSFLAERSKKGIFDKDPDINTNFGLLDNHPIQIDVGRFRHDEKRKEPSVYQNDIIRITDHLRQWLETKEPDLAHYLEDEIRTLTPDPI